MTSEHTSLPPPALTRETTTLARWIIPAFLILFTCIAFIPSLSAGFVNWDDDIEILNNPHIEGLTWPNIQWAFTQYDWTRRYQPLDWISWQINYQLAGRNPFGYHLVNLLEHIVCTLLLYALILKLLQHLFIRPDPANEASQKFLPFAAAIGTLFWAIHPLRVEAVAWATGRIYTQCAMFLASVFLTYLYAQDDTLSRRKRRFFYTLSVFFFICTLLSYSIVVGAALALLLLDIYPLTRIGPRSLNGFFSRAALRVYLEKIPFLAVALAVGLITLWARIHVTANWKPPVTLDEFSLTSRLAQAAYCLIYYLVAPIFPIHLSPVYNTLIHVNPLAPLFIASVIATIFLSLLTLFFWKRAPWLLLLWLFHILMLVPLLGLTEHPHYTNDRYTHMEEFAWAFVLAALLMYFYIRRPLLTFNLIAPLVALLLAFCGMASISQSKIWTNNETFFGHMIATLPNDASRADPLWRLANVYRLQGRLPEASQLVAQSIALDPNDVRAIDVQALLLRDYAAKLTGQKSRDMHAASAKAYDFIYARFHQLSALGFAADQYMEAHDYVSAEERLHLYLRLTPADAGRRYSLAYIEFRSNRLDAAKTDLAQAATDSRGSIDPNATLREWSQGPR